MAVIVPPMWQIKWSAYIQEGDKYVVATRSLRLQVMQKGGVETVSILVSSPDSRLDFPSIPGTIFASLTQLRSAA